MVKVPVKKSLNALNTGQSLIRKKGYNQLNVVIVGSGDVGIKLANNIFNSPEHGLNVIGFYDDSMSRSVKTEESVSDVLVICMIWLMMPNQWI